MGIHTNHNPPVAVAAAAATATVAAAGRVTKDLGGVRPAKDLGRWVGQNHDKGSNDLGWVQLGQVWLGRA